jgi:hypothetical protein
MHDHLYALHAGISSLCGFLAKVRQGQRFTDRPLCNLCGFAFASQVLHVAWTCSSSKLYRLLVTQFFFPEFTHGCVCVRFFVRWETEWVVGTWWLTLFTFVLFTLCSIYNFFFFSFSGATHLSSSLSKAHRGLVKLSLSHCGLTGKGVAQIGHALALNKCMGSSLQHLDLSSNVAKDDINVS